MLKFWQKNHHKLSRNWILSGRTFYFESPCMCRTASIYCLFTAVYSNCRRLSLSVSFLLYHWPFTYKVMYCTARRPLAAMHSLQEVCRERATVRRNHKKLRGPGSVDTDTVVCQCQKRGVSSPLIPGGPGLLKRCS